MQDLRANLFRNCAMVKAVPDIIFRYSGEGVYLDTELKEKSRTMLLFEDKASSIVGQNIDSVLPASIACILKDAIQRTIATGEVQLVEYSYKHQQKTLYFKEHLVLQSENEVISVVRDVTDHKEFEQKLQRQSYYEPLTGLYNRRYFEEAIKSLDKKLKR